MPTLPEAMASLAEAIKLQTDAALRREQQAQATAAKQQQQRADREKKAREESPSVGMAATRNIAGQFGGASNFGLTRLLSGAGQVFGAAADAAKKKGLDALERSSRQTAEVLDDVAQIGGGLGGIITSIIRAPQALFDAMRGFAAMASPSDEKTLQGSFDLLNAAIGKHFIPVMRDAAAVSQAFARGIRTLDLRGFFESRLGGLGGNLLKEWRKQMLTDTVLPTRSGFSGGADFADRLQAAALEAQKDQTGQKLLQEQLAALKDILTAVKDSGRQAAQMGPAFR